MKTLDDIVLKIGLEMNDLELFDTPERERMLARRLLEELAKPSEPVAWLDPDCNDESEAFIFPKLRQQHIDCGSNCENWSVPLYDHTTPRPTQPEAIDLLEMLFGYYQGGFPCYEYPDKEEGYLGNAFLLDPEEESAITRVLRGYDRTKVRQVRQTQPVETLDRGNLVGSDNGLNSVPTLKPHRRG
jgi:hypothetical protein